MSRRFNYKHIFACILIILWILIIVLHNANEDHQLSEGHVKVKLYAEKWNLLYKQLPTKRNKLPEVDDSGKRYADKIKLFYKRSFSKRNDSFINRHQFTFKISSLICEKNKYHIIMVIPSKPSNHHRRSLIRTTYGSVRQYQGKLLTAVFLLGDVNDTHLQDAIFGESERFGDIVQGNFLDSYKNISMKHIMAMHWFRDNCKADFIMKLDDDTFVNPYRLVEFLGTIPVDGFSVIYCKQIYEDLPARNHTSKWYTPLSQYPFRRFPPYCLGFAYITTPSVWETLYRTSTSISPLDMDDVYVTGILALMNEVVRQDIGGIIYQCPNDVNDFDLNMFKQSAIFMDRLNNCSDKAFGLWEYL